VESIFERLARLLLHGGVGRCYRGTRLTFASWVEVVRVDSL
jgi:hypothetical protein